MPFQHTPAMGWLTRNDHRISSLQHPIQRQAIEVLLDRRYRMVDQVTDLATICVVFFGWDHGKSRLNYHLGEYFLTFSKHQI